MAYDTDRGVIRGHAFNLTYPEGLEGGKLWVGVNKNGEFTFTYAGIHHMTDLAEIRTFIDGCIEHGIKISG